MEFKGQVKISDVQEAFDEIVNKINDAIDKYNEASTATSYSLNTGASYLAPEGYSLSIGGLKKILNAYDECVIGCHIWRIGTDEFAVTNGIYIKSNTVTRLPQGMITGSNNGKYLYFNTSNDTYVSSDTKIADTGYIYIRNINLKRNMNICDTSSNYAKNDNLKIFCGDNSLDVNVNDYSDSYRPCFVSATGGRLPSDNDTLYAPIFFLDVKVRELLGSGIHHEKFIYPYYSVIYLPKGVTNPFTSSYPCFKSFSANFEN